MLLQAPVRTLVRIINMGFFVLKNITGTHFRNTSWYERVAPEAEKKNET